MEVEITKIGERGQAVIPKSIREKMSASKGTIFSIVMLDKNTIMMKRIDRKKLLDEFKVLKSSVKKKFSEAEIVEEIKK